MPRVDHLIRRGDRYHWRVRVPARLRASRSHLAIALGTADRSAAERMARHLNEVLANMEEPVPSIDALESIFRDALTALQNGYVSDLRLARRRGPEELVATALRRHRRAWAWHLLDRFNGAEMSFAGDCPALAYLTEHDVPSSWIPDIASDYLDHISVLNSPFADIELDEELAARGFRPSSSGRQAVVAARLRATATAGVRILHAGIPEMAKEEPDGAAADASSNSDAPLVSMAESKPPTDNVVIRVIAPPEIKHQKPVYPWEGDPPRRKGEDLPVDGLLSEAAAMCKLHEEAWTEKTRRQAVQIVRMFHALLVEKGVQTVAEITQRHVASLRMLMQDIIPHYGQGLRPGCAFPAPSELIRRAELAKKEGKPIGLDTNTIRRHFVYVRALLDHLRAQGFDIADIELDGLLPAKKTKFEQGEAAEKFPAETYAPFFRFPMFSGCAGEDAMDRPGPLFIHCGQTIVPIALLYTAARRDEIANADVDDIVEVNSISCFSLRFTDQKR